MSRTAILVLIIIALIIVILLITVNVSKCETFEGPLGFMRITACESEPVLDPG